MKTVLSLLTAIFLMATTATAWSSATWAPGLGGQYDNYANSMLSNGTVYQITNSKLYHHTYAGGKIWNSGVQCNTPTNVRTITIDPTTTTKAITTGVSADIRWASSPDGKNWAWGSIINGWNRNSHYPVKVSCAWRGPNKWLYVTYEDQIVWAAPEPYTNPKPVNLDKNGDGKVVQAEVYRNGALIVVSDYNGGQRDFYELSGSGSNWGSRTAIGPVNTGTDERAPVLGAIDGYIILLGSTNHVGYGYDPWFSNNGNNNTISPTSLGRVKAMFH